MSVPLQKHLTQGSSTWNGRWYYSSISFTLKESPLRFADSAFRQDNEGAYQVLIISNSCLGENCTWFETNMCVVFTYLFSVGELYSRAENLNQNGKRLWWRTGTRKTCVNDENVALCAQNSVIMLGSIVLLHNWGLKPMWSLKERKKIFTLMSDYNFYISTQNRS